MVWRQLWARKSDYDIAHGRWRTGGCLDKGVLFSGDLWMKGRITNILYTPVIGSNGVADLAINAAYSSGQHRTTRRLVGASSLDSSCVLLDQHCEDHDVFVSQSRLRSRPCVCGLPLVTRLGDARVSWTRGEWMHS